MKKAWGFVLRQLVKKEQGQGMVEYGLIIALIALVVIAAITALGGGLNNIFGHISNSVSNVA